MCSIASKKCTNLNISVFLDNKIVYFQVQDVYGEPSFVNLVTYNVSNFQEQSLYSNRAVKILSWLAEFLTR